ncbi:hypothetical protein CDAR_453991 [Caerostris darwini]|uniref:Uncharacterized protein n=1 Tax=Caerostris darwini TaxID=1538125 RepID=A0AAV4V7G9_9ARAC|nr:hypothetical protein CDAR_453991 [Caerostris darwini]
MSESNKEITVPFSPQAITIYPFPYIQDRYKFPQSPTPLFIGIPVDNTTDLFLFTVWHLSPIKTLFFPKPEEKKIPPITQELCSQKLLPQTKAISLLGMFLWPGVAWSSGHDKEPFMTPPRQWVARSSNAKFCYVQVAAGI